VDISWEVLDGCWRIGSFFGFSVQDFGHRYILKMLVPSNLSTVVRVTLALLLSALPVFYYLRHKDLGYATGFPEALVKGEGATIPKVEDATKGGDVVDEREKEVGLLVQERREVRMKVETGRRLVDYDARLKELESELVIETSGKETIILGEEVSDSDEDEDEDEEDEGRYGMSITKLRRTVVQYRLIQELETDLGEHPFVIAQASRMVKIRSTLLMDLSTALQQAKSAGESGADRVMKVMKIYADMEESAEAVKVLKTLKA